MSPEAMRIALQLRDAIKAHKLEIAKIPNKQGSVFTGGSALPIILRTPHTRSSLPAQPLNREEMAIREEGTRKLRDFQASRYYARLRMQARSQMLATRPVRDFECTRSLPEECGGERPCKPDAQSNGGVAK